ncbi:ATP-dependent helicase/deoxyribonuclease subunit B [Babesia caballi]|uniref:ATP-dependent helicase/deoxyribonuclease subunit B n=1 Tax=Babesia caballi TaxID=5871 RepID=A0AAV4LPG1_BABCB|nr:ATP-dependent helicase/deoxyribonuclease subunit B [Babesia caballi]
MLGNTPTTMEERGSEAAAKPGTVSRRLQSNLDRSIEAHRLRLQKARSTKTDKHGRLCECKNCDVTSMKPSMRCLASGAAKPQLGTNNEKLPRRSAGSLEKVTVKGGTSQCGRQRCTAEKPAPMVPTTRRAADTIRGKVDVKRDNVTEELRRPSCLPLERNEVYAVEEQHVVSSRSTGKYSTVRPVEVSRDVEQGLSSGRAQYATGGCEDVSALSRCSSARTKYDGRASDVSPTTDAQVDGVTRRLESIRVSESAREHYQLDTAELESRILDIVDKVVTHRLNEVKDNGVASKGEDCRGDVEIPAVKASNSQEQTSVTSGERSPTHVTVGSIDSIGTAQTSAQKEASVTSDHNESPGKYKSVVDILLNYISCSPVGRPKPGTDQTKNVKVTATQTSFTPKISYMAQTVGEFRQATGNLHASKSSDMSWESGVVGSRACHNGVAEGNVVKTECGAMGGVTMPHTEVTNHYRASNAAPSGRQQPYAGRKRLLKWPRPANVRGLPLPGPIRAACPRLQPGDELPRPGDGAHDGETSRADAAQAAHSETQQHVGVDAPTSESYSDPGDDAEGCRPAVRVQRRDPPRDRLLQPRLDDRLAAAVADADGPAPGNGIPVSPEYRPRLRTAGAGRDDLSQPQCSISAFDVEFQ